MEETARYFPPKREGLTDAVMAWIVMVTVVVDVVVFGILLWNSYATARKHRETLELLARLGPGECRVQEDITAPSVFTHKTWLFSFELPGGHAAVEELEPKDGSVLLRIVRSGDPGTPKNTLGDTAVRVWVGPASGFSKYFAKPYTAYAGYRRLSAVGRQAVGYGDPEGEYAAWQVVAIDDARNDREIRVSWSGIREDAEIIANGIIRTMRLAAREQKELVYKPGWKTYVEEPLRFQYPEDYVVERVFAKKVVVKGRGGRLEIASAFEVDETGRRRTGNLLENLDQQLPDDFFDLTYDVNVRIGYYYAQGASDYDKSILREIAGTITLNK